MLANMPAAKEQDTSVQNPQLTAVRPPFQPQKTKKPRVSFNKLMLSTYFRIGLTFFLLILLFLTASFIAFQSEQKRKKLKDYEKPIPDAEILVPETNDDSTENWETYRNEEFGFEMKYPQGWYLNSEIPVEISSTPPDQYIHGVGKPPSGNAWVNLTTVETAGVEGVLDEYEVGPNAIIISSSYYKKSPTLVLKITTSYWKDDPNPQEKRLTFDQILSTFKFLD